MIIKNKLAIIIASCALIIASVGIASAAIPDSDDGEFHACVKTSGNATGHEWRVIDKQASEACANGWTEKIIGSYSPDHEIVVGEESVQPNTIAHVTATCPTGKSITGGGFTSDSNPQFVLVQGSYPDTQEQTWHVDAFVGNAPVATLVRSLAVCTAD